MRAWRPPDRTPLSEWLDRNYVPSATQGFWRTIPFQRGMADAFADPEIETVTIQKSARIGFTKLLVGYFCYRIATDPCGILIVQPAQEDAEGFSKEDLAPAIDATPAVAGLVADPRSRVSDNTIAHKSFPGGFLKVIGAHSGRGFRRITTELVAFDEVDAYPSGAGSEGDQIELGKKRAHTAAFPKFILGSSPKLKSTSRICQSFAESDQRDFIVPCLHCDHGQRLVWGGVEADHGIKWPSGHPEEAYYLCANCHSSIEHHELGEMVEQGFRQQGRGGGWVASRPGVVGHAGFRIWAGYSPFPAAAGGVLASEGMRVKDDPLKLQVFVNTVLGEPYELAGRSPNRHVLMLRREEYPTRPTERVDAVTGKPETELMVPEGVIWLTAWTDVQLGRVECGVEGWGLGEENWKLEYHVIRGDTTARPLYDELWDYLNRPRHLARGGVAYIRASGIDSRYAEESVLAFTRGRSIYRTADGHRAYLWPTKGVSGSGPVWPDKPQKRRPQKAPFYSIHVDSAKDVIFERTRRIDAPGPGYIHYPMSFSEDWFRQYEAEHALDEVDRKGFPRRVYALKAGHRRNEALDVAVGNYAMLCGLFALGMSLEREAKKLARLAAPVVRVEEHSATTPSSFVQPEAPPDPIVPAPRKRARRVIHSNWMYRG